MNRKTLELRNCSFEILHNGDTFAGIGRVWIGGTLVRSGRLPWRPMTATFTGHELATLKLLGVEQSARKLRVRLHALFRPAFTKIMPDHSIDPIHETGDWDRETSSGDGEFEMVFTPAGDSFGGSSFTGFAFHYEYRSRTMPLFFIYDMSSWELGGNIQGATAISQSSCSAPVAVFEKNTKWTTEGIIHWADEKSMANPVMTHNLPRWASHQAFDYQFKRNHTLVGTWEHVDLIRSVLRREPGKPELKTFDKYIFDQTLAHKTPAKNILLNTAPRTWVGQQNLWTWTMQEVHDRARAEFGIPEEPVLQRLAVNYWVNFTIDSYYVDLLPAATACGFKALFIDNLCKSDMTEKVYTGNMCCSHEFETAPALGGPAKLKRFVSHCAEHGIVPYSWANPNQSCASPLFRGTNNLARKLGTRNWFIRMADTRSPYCGAYIPEGSGLDMSMEAPRRYWTGCLKKIKKETGLRAYLWDSFYNSAFMTVSYADGTPHTTWGGVLAALKDMRDAGLHFMIESFGPFGDVQHGCPAAYGPKNIFACYKIQLGTGYTTIPSGHDQPRPEPWPVPDYYRILAHMSKPDHQLYYPAGRIDTLFADGHKRALADYNASYPRMCKRFLQEDGKSVLWHDKPGRRATLWNFAARDAALPGDVTDLTAGTRLPKAAAYRLEPCHTYAITGAKTLPTTVAHAEC